LANLPRYYWDACAWIALIQQEPQRFESLSHIIDEAKKGNAAIWTSNFTLAEVYKRPCDGDWKGLSAVEDTPFEEFILQDFVTRVQVDLDVGILARRLLRTYPAIRKPQDGIHLATALLNNIDELHTYDREDLLGLDGIIDRKDGTKLRICEPSPRPVLAQRQLLPIEEHIEKSRSAEMSNQASSGQGGG